MKESVTIDIIRLKSNIENNQTLIFTKRSFFYTILGFRQSHSGPLGDFDGYIQITQDTYKSDRPINVTAIDQAHLKCKCIDGSIVDGCKQPILFWFGLSSLPGHRIYNQPGVKLFKKTNESVLSHITF